MLIRQHIYRKLFTSSILAVALCFALLSLAQAAPGRIRILYANDFHGFAEPYRPAGSQELVGGIAYLSGKIDELRGDKSIPTFLLSAGDMIQGHLWTNLNQGKATIDLMNYMKFDAMVAGNHEFDFGQTALKERITQANFPVLGANVTGLSALKPYVIKTVGGIRVGILGIVTEQVPILTHPDNIVGLSFIKPVEICRRTIDEVRKQSDVVIALTHIGFEEDRLLAEQCSGIDAIIGGHSHTKVAEPPMIGGVIVLQAWEHAKSLGVLDLTIEDGRTTKKHGYLLEIKPAAGPADKHAEAVVARYAAAVDGSMKVVFGSVCRDLDNQNVRVQETSLGNMIADALRETSRADIALINAGSIRTNLKGGGVTLKDVYSVLPFDTYIVNMDLKGGQILQALEHGLSMIEKKSGAFLQVSGLQVIYDANEPAGRRVKEVMVAGKRLNIDQYYRVAVNDFMAAGGDGYAILKSSAGPQGADKGLLVRDVLIANIKAKGVVCPPTEGERIVQQLGQNVKDTGLRQ